MGHHGPPSPVSRKRLRWETVGLLRLLQFVGVCALRIFPGAYLASALPLMVVVFSGRDFARTRDNAAAGSAARSLF